MWPDPTGKGQLDPAAGTIIKVEGGKREYSNTPLYFTYEL